MTKEVRHINHAPWSKRQKAQQNLSLGKAKQGSERKNRRKHERRGRFLSRKRQGNKHRKGSNTRQKVRNKNKIMREKRSWQGSKYAEKENQTSPQSVKRRRIGKIGREGKDLVFYAKEEEKDKKEEEFAGEEKDLDRGGGFMLQVFRIDQFSNFEFQFFDVLQYIQVSTSHQDLKTSCLPNFLKEIPRLPMKQLQYSIMVHFKLTWLQTPFKVSPLPPPRLLLILRALLLLFLPLLNIGVGGKNILEAVP